MNQHFKGVVWPRQSADAKVKGKRKEVKVYRYVVVGMIVTDEPISEFEGKNEIFMDGPVKDMIEPFTKVKSRKPSYVFGDASSLLCGLNEL